MDAEKINQITQPAAEYACSNCEDMGLFESAERWEDFRADLTFHILPFMGLLQVAVLEVEDH